MDREKIIEAFDDAKELVWLDDDEYTVGYNNGIEAGKNITLAMLKEYETMMQCIKGKCRICPHCANCDVDENGLLKEQEAVEPKQVDLYGNDEWWGLVCVCPDCKAEWMSDKADTHFCPKCGRQVKWE